ncbi:MAG: hypothetical protein IPK16_29520 [Anaerolineales bacterium]|nr:hypothetical protein [Anaerolineales bacterium]
MPGNSRAAQRRKAWRQFAAAMASGLRKIHRWGDPAIRLRSLMDLALAAGCAGSLSQGLSMSQPEVRFVIVTNGRTGSTLLVNLLRSHPAIQCEDEILNERRWQGAQRPLGWLVRTEPAPYLAWRARRATKPVFGFKLKTGAQVVDLGRTLGSLYRRGWRLIYLARRDALQQTFSWCVAQASGRWQSNGDHPIRDNNGVTLDVAAFQRDLSACVQDRQHLAALLHRWPHLALVYEDDLQHSDLWPATGARLCAFLGVAPAPLTSQVARTWERPYAEVVTNYAEILAAVAAGPFAYLVDREQG